MRRLRRLLRQRPDRWSEGAFVLEGPDLLAGALEAGTEIEGVYVGAEGRGDPALEALVARAAGAGVPVDQLAPGVLAKVADAVTPQPVLAVAPMVHRPLEDLGPQALVVVAVGLADPGNLGTLLRSAEAAGAAVVVAGDSVDPYNPKAVRASAGTLLAVPLVVDADVLGVLDALGRQGYRRLATVVHGGSDYVALDWGRPSALVLGNEAAGLDDATLAACDERVSVPMVGRAESLNVAMAGTVLCFEALAARRRPGGSVAGASAAGSTMPPMSAGRPPAR